METINRQIDSKINIIKSFLSKSNVVPTRSIVFKNRINEIEIDILNIEKKNKLKTNFLFLELSLTDSLEEKEKLKKRYLQVLSDENIINGLNKIVDDCELLLELLINKQIKTKLKSYLDKYKNIISYYCDLSSFLQTNNYTECTTCKTQMINDIDTAELVCQTCGNIVKLIGTIYVDVSTNSIDRIKNKNGKFNPNRHFEFWWIHILAKEPEDELGDPNDQLNHNGEKVIMKLREIIRRDRKILRKLTVNDIRYMLKEIKRTDLNKNVPLILKKLTGIGPPIVPDTLSRRVEELFSRVIEIGERKMSPDRTNKNYYPYYIYKIIDAIIPNSNYEIRRILYYIYLQSPATIIQDDQIFKAITEEMTEIPFKLTDRFYALKYAPM